MSPKPDVSAERIPQILEAAVAVFSRKGLASARMDDIAKEAGLSKGTLYLYFDSRDAIIQGIMESFLARELDLAQELIEAELPCIEKIDHLTTIMVSDVTKLQPFIPLYLEFIALSIRAPQVQNAIQAYFSAFIHLIQTILQQGIADKEIREVDAHDTALTLAAVVEGSILIWVYAPEQINPEQQIRKGIQVLVDGLVRKGE